MPTAIEAIAELMWKAMQAEVTEEQVTAFAARMQKYAHVPRFQAVLNDLTADWKRAIRRICVHNISLDKPCKHCAEINGPEPGYRLITGADESFWR